MSPGRARIATGGVVSRAATEYLGPRGCYLRGRSSAAGRVTPFVLWVGRYVRGVPQVVRVVIDAVGRACLQQEDGTARILAETCREDAAGRPASHDDDVGVAGATATGIGHEFGS